MRAVIQRVLSAQVDVDGKTVGKIGRGVMTLLGIRQGDSEKELDWLIGKIARLRIFEDEQGKLNRSLLDVGGEHLIVSQFTLYGDARQGNRPSFIDAARPEAARPLYEKALELSRGLGLKTEGGQFQADMKVALVNDGPVTLILESRE